ncbi:sensor histidine kinase [Paraconexibacter algicola]|uniref:histidine kinase n=1 Tax=Paraconexibacter algicola TaxID=2133960 RepID=A0A2T4UEL0_9ACTN|nr:sensor histidine kinase [Paraconexibacter algicola]PTL56218.1 hypothetical protein C7Y72_14630 [Paraconexibacter algicola]
MSLPRPIPPARDTPISGPPSDPAPVRHDRRAPGHGRAAGIAARLSAEPGSVDELTRREGAVTLARGRLALTTATAAAAFLGPTREDGLWVLLVLGVAWTLWTNLRVLRHRRLPLPLLWCSLVDGLFVAAAFPLSGGTDSLVAVPLIAIPSLLTVLYTPRETGLLPVVPYLAFLACAIVEIASGDGDAARTLLVVTLALAATMVIAVLASRVRVRAAARTSELYALRRGLLAQALAAEERASRRLSEALHDHALQTLLAAAQDLGEVVPRDDASRATLLHAQRNLADGIGDLRRTVRQLHPITLSSGGLAGAIARLAHEQAERTGFEARVDVDEAACGRHDELVFSLVRELVTNAAKHADADQVVVRVEATDGWIDLEVVDDGVGMADGREQEAVGDGHIGLASTRERVEAAGGWLVVESAQARGTAVRVRLPG